jgi:N-acetylneuraminic acid mutarotase
MAKSDFGGKWIQVGDMLAAHEKHAAESLLTGEVLILGGGSEGGTSFEVYDPVARRFHKAGKMVATCEWGHRTVRLQDGRILALGGCNMMTPGTHIQVYDPKREQLLYFGDMYLPRDYAVVVRLKDSLLIAGGYGGDRMYGERHRCLREAEVFDLRIGESTAFVDMNAARTVHTGTLLQDGTVLIAGGISYSSLHSTSIEQTAEIYHPQTREFSLTGHMGVERACHTAILLNDGRVLIVGGHGHSYNALNSAEMYNPMTGTFSIVSVMNTARYDHTATRLQNGYVLIAGGNEGAPSFNRLDSVEVYDPYSNVFHQVSSMNVCRDRHTATLLKDGNVLIVGGTGIDNEALCSAEVYVL